jgi:hypothetical protein
LSFHDDEPVEVAGLVDVMADLVHAGVEVEVVAAHLVDRRHDDPVQVADDLEEWERLLVCARDIKDTIDGIYRTVGAVLAGHYHEEGRKPRDRWEADGRTFTLSQGRVRKEVDHVGLANALAVYCDMEGLAPAEAAETVLKVVPLTKSTGVKVGGLREMGLNPDLYVEYFDRGPDLVTVTAAPFLDLHEGDL